MAGRPATYNSPDELQSAIDQYFEYIKGEKDVREPEPPTITGLALYLGFESRQSFYDYGEREEYSYIIKKARFKVEHGYEKQLYKQTSTGAIFALKNMGWKDKTEQEVNLSGGLLLNIQPADGNDPIQD